MFVWADDGSELKVDVPVVFKGEDVCPGLQKGIFAFFVSDNVLVFLDFSSLYDSIH